MYVGIPISIFLDNARYQKYALVMEKAKSLNIEWSFLHSYSPNLDLIERVWKFVKKKCWYSKYYEKFPAFKEAISHCLEETMTTHKAELGSLLTLRFQVFEKTQFVTACGILLILRGQLLARLECCGAARGSTTIPVPCSGKDGKSGIGKETR